MTRVRAFVFLIAFVVLVGPVNAQKDRTAADIVRAATGYLASDAPRVSGVSLEPAPPASHIALTTPAMVKR